MEHGIQFNKPYVDGAYPWWLEPQMNNKKVGRIAGSNGGGYTNDIPQILVPLSVIDDKVFCISIIQRSSNGPTEYEIQPPTYPGGVPGTFASYMQDIERIGYYSMIPVKEFIKQWKVKE